MYHEIHQRAHDREPKRNRLGLANNQNLGLWEGGWSIVPGLELGYNRWAFVQTKKIHPTKFTTELNVYSMRIQALVTGVYLSTCFSERHSGMRQCH